MRAPDLIRSFTLRLTAIIQLYGGQGVHMHTTHSVCDFKVEDLELDVVAFETPKLHPEAVTGVPQVTRVME